MKRYSVEEVEEEPTVNLTPLIDIVFVILMAFIIAVPLIRLDSIALAPGSQEQERITDQENKTIVIKVFADNSVTLNDAWVSLQDLSPQLSLLYKQYPNHVPLLLQDGDTTFKVYQKIKMAVEAAGFHELHVALQS
ncbi:ExbD/TolR family protein [Candidatus Chlamydia sanziniae]|uniref:Biopolymer transport protein ExbD/TolR n=1 Tax=Candidatus Chlamydia sanziniae TaxID=1806891 RepID=A0A1A9HUS8_9CHLA|nr:biopolymer transporter ExbD [Candidatus Chlamydia sanziniae]ANH78585.1 Biopolymer transport protein ExbD/TolR [Candidatus Chlamydia sanziniae]